METAFSLLTARFPKHVHAVTAAGFVLRLALCIFARTLDLAGRGTLLEGERWMAPPGGPARSLEAVTAGFAWLIEPGS